MGKVRRGRSRSDNISCFYQKSNQLSRNRNFLEKKGYSETNYGNGLINKKSDKIICLIKGTIPIISFAVPGPNKKLLLLLN